MKKGFRLKDDSVWTIISYDTTKEYIDKCDRGVFPKNVLVVTGVRWEGGGIEFTHPYNANFSDCCFEHFKVDDERMDIIVEDVFDLINWD